MQSLTVVFFDRNKKVSRTFASGGTMMTAASAEVEFSEGATAAVYVDGERVANEFNSTGLFVALFEHGGELIHELVRREE